MQTIHTELETLLKKDKRLVADGKLMKNKVIEFALKLDKELLKLLKDNKSVKNHFFQEVDSVLVFDKVKFQDFVNLKSFLADSYTKYKSKIGLEVDGDYLSKSKDVVLVWPYKDCLLEGGQTKAERENRSEIFWNETLAPEHYDRLLSPKAFTNFKKYDSKGEHELKDKIDFGKENLLVKGNNLLALHSLKERFEGKVKLIYIDPPYNTGNDDFGYNDSFNHSTWLTFMKNRLEVAKDLLSNDGTIFISIDHNEIAYLIALMDEIFGKENKRNIITVKRGSVTGAKVINPGVVNISEFLLVYSRNENNWKPKRVFRGKTRDERYNTFISNYENNFAKWKFIPLLDAFATHKGIKKSELKKQLKEDFESELVKFILKQPERVVRFASLDENSISKEAKEIKSASLKNGDKVHKLEREGKRTYFILEGELILFAKDRLMEIDGTLTFSDPVADIWDDVLPNDLHNEGGVALRKGKKPEKLIQRIIDIGSDKGELVMDFFSGSGTAASVAHKMNRRFIAVEQLDYIEELPLNRLVNTIKGEQSGISDSVKWKGGGSFIYCELAKDNAQYIDKIEKAKKTEELKKIWAEMQKEGFISHRIKETEVFGDEGQIKWKDLSLDEQKQILIRTLDLNHLYINYSEMDDERYKKTMDDETKNLNKQFYSAK